MKSANDFVNNSELKEGKMKVFIPRNFIETFGVIRNVPLCWTEQDIVRDIVSSMKIASVKRLAKKDSSIPNKFNPTETIKIGFFVDEHSQWVVFNKTVLTVDTYYSAVRQCHKCGGLGHTILGCRSEERKCDGNCKQ